MARLKYRVSRDFYSRSTALATAEAIVKQDLKAGVYDYKLKDGKFDIDAEVENLVKAVVVDDDGKEIVECRL